MWQMRKLIVLLGVIGILVLTFLFFKNKYSEKIKTDPEKSLSALTTIDLSPNCKLYVVINSDSVWFEPFENVCSGAKSLSIEKKDFPNLFKQGVGNGSFISAEKASDINTSIVVSNNQPDHGGYLPVYQLIINPKTGEIKEYKTEVKAFIPEVPTKITKGNCWTTSLASPLNDKAWRCMTEHFIYDPCFETETGKIVCDSYPDDTSKAFTVDLEEPLPERATDSGGWRYYSKETPNNEDDFWVLELENGYKCYAMTGTLPFVNNQTFYYGCVGDGEAKYAGQVQTSTPVFTTTIVSEKVGYQEKVDWSKFQDMKIVKVWK